MGTQKGQGAVGHRDDRTQVLVLVLLAQLSRKEGAAPLLHDPLEIQVLDVEIHRVRRRSAHAGEKALVE